MPYHNCMHACDVLQYELGAHAEFEAALGKYDAFIVRVNPGQIDNAKKGGQQIFDAMMSKLASQGKPVWSFYDGPPFATGLPHYGHLLAGTIKASPEPRHARPPPPP